VKPFTVLTEFPITMLLLVLVCMGYNEGGESEFIVRKDRVEDACFNYLAIQAKK